MKVVVSAGGTGGHIYPALAIINKIKQKQPNSEFLYIGTHNRMEKDIIPNYNIPYEAIEIYGFNRKNMFQNFKTLSSLLKANKRCKKILKDFKPDIVIGAGGYVTVPVIKEASKLGYKTFIHEQNSVPGKANVYLSKYADIIGVSFASTKQHFPSNKVVITGNPCGEEAINVLTADKKEFNLKENRPLVLFVMGSLGASKVNEFLVKTMTLFNNKEYDVLYVTGNKDYEEIKKYNFPSNVKVVPYIEKMIRIMKKTDIIVSRAGASTLSEIIALQIPSILIPSPYVPDNHQFKNALDLVDKKAAILIEEKDLKGDILVREIDKLINDKNKISAIKNNLRQNNISNSATVIYDSIIKLVGE